MVIIGIYTVRYSDSNVAFPTKLFKRELIDELRFPEEGSFDDIALMYKLIAKAKKVSYHGLPKYTFYRHESNNSSWTTNHRLITPQILDEYLESYRTRTEWLSEHFPASAKSFRYFEWSFMISMVEKIIRLELPNCEKQLEYMKNTLFDNRYEFLSCPEMLDFEREWMCIYITQGIADEYYDQYLQKLGH